VLSQRQTASDPDPDRARRVADRIDGPSTPEADDYLVKPFRLGGSEGH